MINQYQIDAGRFPMESTINLFLEINKCTEEETGLGEVMWLTQGTQLSTWRRQNSNPSLYSSKSYALCCLVPICYVSAHSLQLYLTLYNPMDCSLPSSSVHEILQARIPEGWHWKTFLFNLPKHWKQCQTLFLGAPKSQQMVITAMKLKDAYSLEEKLWPT